MRPEAAALASSEISTAINSRFPIAPKFDASSDEPVGA
jgi:hypothetical protein